MAKEVMQVGVLVAEEKTFTDSETGKTRNYLSYYVEFENGAIVHFVPRQNDRALLTFILELSK